MKYLKNKNVIAWIINFILSIALLFVGYKLTKNKYIKLTGENAAIEATVTEIVKKNETSYEYEGKQNKNIEIIFKAKLKDGKIIEATQTIDDFSSSFFLQTVLPLT